MIMINNSTTAIPAISSLVSSSFFSSTTSAPLTTLMSTMNTSHVNGSVNATRLPPAPNQCPSKQNSDEEKLLKIIGYCILLVISLVGNIFIITVILSNKKMKKPTNYFILNMAFSDLVVPTLVLPREIAIVDLGRFGWAIDGDLGMVLCKLTYFLQDVSNAVSIASLILITIDRFCAVVFPMKHYIMSGFVCKIAIGISWLTGMSLHAIYLYTLDIKIIRSRLVCYNFWNKIGSSNPVKQRYYLAIFFLLAVLPFLVMATAYTIIYVKLKRQSLPLGDSFTDRQKRQRALRERKVLLMAVAIVISFALLWAPINASAFLNFFVYDSPQPCWMHTFGDIAFYCVYANAAVNPCICFVFSENFRQGFKDVLARLGILSGRHALGQQQTTQISMSATQPRFNKAYDDEDEEAKQDASSYDHQF